MKSSKYCVLMRSSVRRNKLSVNNFIIVVYVYIIHVIDKLLFKATYAVDVRE